MSHSVLISGFADEAANEKTVDQQFAVLAALGMSYFSIRFLDAGNGIKNVMQLSDKEIEFVRKKMDQYQLQVSSIGSPIGKVKLLDVEDQSENKFVPGDSYLANYVQRACQLATAFDCKLIRGFSFYHPQGEPPEPYIEQASKRLLEIAQLCDSYGLTFGLEVETNLIGQTGSILAEMHRQINHAALALIFDGGNLVSQGFSSDEIFQQYLDMKPGLGWLHIKDYVDGKPAVDGVIDEDALHNYVPISQGDTGYANILADLKEFLPEMETRLQARLIPGVFLDLEPHLKGGGQFGGFSGPDGFGVAFRDLCNTLRSVDIQFGIRDFECIKNAHRRGLDVSN